MKAWERFSHIQYSLISQHRLACDICPGWTEFGLILNRSKGQIYCDHSRNGGAVPTGFDEITVQITNGAILIQPMALLSLS